MAYGCKFVKFESQTKLFATGNYNFVSNACLEVFLLRILSSSGLDKAHGRSNFNVLYGVISLIYHTIILSVQKFTKNKVFLGDSLINWNLL